MNKPRVSIRVGDDDAGQRLDRFLAATLEGFSRTQVQNLNATGAVLVDGRIRPDSFSLSTGETIDVEVSAAAVNASDRAPVPQNIDVPVVYEDDSLVVVNKAAGMVVHPAHGNWDGTLVNALLGRGTPLSRLGPTGRESCTVSTRTRRESWCWRRRTPHTDHWLHSSRRRKPRRRTTRSSTVTCVRARSASKNPSRAIPSTGNAWRFPVRADARRARMCSW